MTRKRFSEMSPREQLNFACCGDPDDDDTLLIDEDDDGESQDN